MMRLQFSGFRKEFRYDVFNSAKKAYGLMMQRDETGERPLHRPKEWEREKKEREDGEEEIVVQIQW